MRTRKFALEINWPLISVQSLLRDLNPDSPANPIAAQLFMRNKPVYREIPKWSAKNEIPNEPVSPIYLCRWTSLSGYFSKKMESPTFDVLSILISVQCFLGDPNLDSPANPRFRNHICTLNSLEITGYRHQKKMPNNSLTKHSPTSPNLFMQNKPEYVKRVKLCVEESYIDDPDAPLDLRKPLDETE